MSETCSDERFVCIFAFGENNCLAAIQLAGIRKSK